MIEIDELKVNEIPDTANPNGGVLCGFGTCGGMVCGITCEIASGSGCGVGCSK